MQDPEFQKRYRKFLKRNGLEYGTSDPRKIEIWHRFWDVEMEKWYERRERDQKVTSAGGEADAVSD